MNPVSLGEPFARGRTADVYAWGEHEILKLFNPGIPDPVVQHEIEMARRVSATNLPTPKFIGEVEIEDRRGIVFERVDGTSMLQLITAKPWLVWKFAREFAELHTQIHQHDGEGLPLVRSDLVQAIRNADGLPAVDKSAILEVLNTLPDGSALCHFDFHPDQVLVSRNGPQVIDWLTARQGSPAADVATTAVLFNFAQIPYGSWVMHAIIQLWRGIFFRTYLNRYVALNPTVSRHAIRTWMIPIAAARYGEKRPGEARPLLRFLQSSLKTGAERRQVVSDKAADS